jgi:hypothetical protein
MSIEKNDVTAVLETFTHEELALWLTRYAHANGEVIVPKSTRSAAYPALVAKVRSTGSNAEGQPTSFRITAHEPERETGYYLVFDGSYLRDIVAWWDASQGAWRSSHKGGGEPLGGGRNVTVVERLDLKAE